MQSVCKDKKHNIVFTWHMNMQHQQRRKLVQFFVHSLYWVQHRKTVTSHLCVGVFMGGSGQYMPNSNRSWALFSLEVKTQTRTKNAARVMQLVFLQCICSTTPHSCWKRQTERRPGRKDKRVTRVQSTESYETCSGGLFSLYGSYLLLGNTLLQLLYIETLIHVHQQLLR